MKRGRNKSVCLAIRLDYRMDSYQGELGRFVKKLIRTVFILISISLSLSACEPASTSPVTCKPASNPFADLLSSSESEYWGGYYPNTEISRVCEFEGQVHKGGMYRQKFADGLVFCLIPDKEDWTIAVSGSSQSDCNENFSVFVTPPWYGENPLYINGYQFRNWDNTGENDGSVNAPQEVRSFNFVLNHDDYENMDRIHRCMRWSINCLPETSNEIVVDRSRGILTITDLVLGNLIPNERAWIETMDFKVEIYLPAE